MFIIVSMMGYCMPESIVIQGGYRVCLAKAYKNIWFGIPIFLIYRIQQVYF